MQKSQPLILGTQEDEEDGEDEEGEEEEATLDDQQDGNQTRSNDPDRSRLLGRTWP